MLITPYYTSIWRFLGRKLYTVFGRDAPPLPVDRTVLMPCREWLHEVWGLVSSEGLYLRPLEMLELVTLTCGVALNPIRWVWSVIPVHWYSPSYLHSYSWICTIHNYISMKQKSISSAIHNCSIDIRFLSHEGCQPRDLGLLGARADTVGQLRECTLCLLHYPSQDMLCHGNLGVYLRSGLAVTLFVSQMWVTKFPFWYIADSEYLQLTYSGVH